MILLWASWLACPSLARPDDREDRLPESWKKWLKEDVVYIITDVEREAFLSLESESERDAFETAFWRHRDTNPSTAENEYEIEHYERLAHANEFLGRDTFRPGWMTDRGHYYILLGPPNTVQNFDHEDSIYPVELWFYNDPKLKALGLPPYFYLLFFRRQGGGELELYSPSMDGPQELLTGYQTVSLDRSNDVESAYYKLYGIHPELAQASLSFRTDEGDIVNFTAPSFGTVALLQEIAASPFRGVDTTYAERLDVDRGLVESDFLFAYVPSHGTLALFPGPGKSFFLHWVIEIDPQYVAVVQDVDQKLFGTAFISSVEVVSHEDSSQIVVETRKESFLRMSEADAARRGGLSGPYAFRGMTPLVPGTFDVRVILRNRACASREESDCVKSYTMLEGEVVVPDSDQPGPALSDLVLAYAVERPPGEPAYRPYRFGTVDVHSNPRGVYALGDPVIAAVAPLGTEAGSKVRFRVFPSESEATPLVESELATDGLGLEPLVPELSVASLEPGFYRLTADLLSPAGAIIASRSMPFTVTPRTRVDRPTVRGTAPSIAVDVPGAVEMALGDEYFRLEKKEKAKERYEAALASNPRLGPAIEAVAVMEMEQSNWSRVVELLEPLYREVQSRYVVLALLGEAYYRQGEYRRAVEVLDKAARLERPSPAVLNALGISRYRLGEASEAKALLQRSLELEPDQPEIEKVLRAIESEGR